ncbi:MAG: N-acetylglucosamine-6-phosphate deacetylase [Bryobacteraceae bacterium]|jgi:N-acetylglucosamine-6-phosphate deacetylase
MKCSGVDVATGRFIAIEFDEIIQEIVPAEGTGEHADAVLLAPGFVDIQVNGFAGVDFNNPQASVEEIGRAVGAILRCGVTRFLPTVITGAPDDMLACLRNLRRAQTTIKWGRAMAGFHVEGPHIGPEDGPRGAHPARWVRPPDLAEFQRWQEATDGQIRLITLSPHWPGAAEYIAAIVEAGVTASIGHTGATEAQIAAAVDAGATLSTHLGNAAHAVLPKHPNYIWDQLAEDRLSASFIVDGIHLEPAFLRTALRAKTVERTVLVTDASAPAGAAPGRYRLGEQEADLTEDGRVVLAGTDKLAGSALRMNQGVANLVQLGGLSLRDAVRTATVNPARVIRLEGRMRGLEPGERADIVAFRFKGATVEIDAVWLDGVRAE